MYNMQTYLAVCLFYLCGLSLSQECIRELSENIDFPGTDLTFLYSPDVHHCQLLCTQHANCQFFTFLRSDWTKTKKNFYCYLKSNSAGVPNEQVALLGVTSGYSLKPCRTNSTIADIDTKDVCLSQVYHNIDFYGADYRTLFTSDYEECQRVCTHDPGCKFFTFVNGVYSDIKIRYKCHLKYSWTVPKIENIDAKVGVVTGFSNKLLARQENQISCEPKFFHSTNIPGHDMELLPASSAAHCLSLCSAHPQCTYFSYVRNDFRCYLKSNHNELVTSALDGVISGLPARHCVPDNSWLKKSYEGVDFQGSDILFIRKDEPASCQTVCDEDPNCLFYTYVFNTFHNPVHRRRCYLKRVITLPLPMKVTHLMNVVSGFSLKNC